MCGILATIGVVPSPERRAAAVDSLRHRGPDAEGQWSSDRDAVWLGHRRLAIVDLSEAGTQPLFSEDRNVVLVCNGEVYNYGRLRRRLEDLGHRFASDSDSEVIIHAYEQWGEDCLSQLEGMFAFVLWDAARQRLFAARDRVGIKPLYYCRDADGSVLLASEADALLKVLGRRPTPDGTALAYVMTLGYVPTPWSIWKGIRKLRPGHFLVGTSGADIVERLYWEPPREIGAPVEDESEEWEELFHGVLRDHLLADVPIGLFLSGGLDSSSVLLGLRRLGVAVPSLTVAFPSGAHHSEGPIASNLARHLEVPNEQVALSLPDVRNLLCRAMHHCDEPAGYSAWLSMYLLCEVAATRHRVVLAGDGGDEVFGGYRWYRAGTQSGSAMAVWLRRLTGEARARWLPGLGVRYAMSQFRRCSVLHQHAWHVYPRFLPEEAEFLLRPLETAFDDQAMLAPLREHYVPSMPPQRALQRIDLMTFCSDVVLAKVDRASMAFGLETRVPLLDHRVVEWGLRRPVAPKEAEVGKQVLRRYLHGRVPTAVLQHPKQGFSLPILGGFDWERAVDEIDQGPWVRGGYWNRDWKRLLSPRVPYRQSRIWNLLALTKWAEYRICTQPEDRQLRSGDEKTATVATRVVERGQRVA